MRVTIDPGHGGIHDGVVVPGLIEDHYTLEMAERVRDILLLAYPTLDVQLTRNEDIYVSLAERASRASDSDLVVSLHVDAYPADSTVWGTSIFYRAYDAWFADVFVNRLPRLRLRQVPDARYPNPLAFLVPHTVPAVLIEMGYATSARDLTRLLAPAGKAEIALGIAGGIQTALTRSR